MQLILWKSRSPTFSHLLSKPTVNEKLTLLRNALVPQPFSAAATLRLPPNPRFPSTAYLQVQKSGMFFARSAVGLTDVDRWEGLSDVTYTWPPRFSGLKK